MNKPGKLFRSTDTILPIPGPRTRLLLLGGLLIWQLAALWMLPLMHREQLFQRDADRPWLAQWRRLQPIADETTEVISGGLLLAVLGNAALVLIKTRLDWPVRILVVAVMMIAPALGYIAAFGGYSPMDGKCYFPVATGLVTFSLGALAWWKGPYLRNFEMAHLDDEHTTAFKPSTQFGLWHLLVLMAASAVFVGMYQWIGGIKMRFFFFGLPLTYRFALMEIVLLGLLITLGTQLSCLLDDSGPGPWIAVLIAPTICILGLLLTLDFFLHGRGSLRMLYVYLFVVQSVWLAGTGFAMRLLGYRLAYVKQPSL